MKKLLSLFAAVAIAVFAKAAVNDVQLSQVVSLGPPIRSNPVQVPMESAISATLASWRSAQGLGTEDSPGFTNTTLTGYIQLAEQAAPGTPTNAGRIYFDTSNRLSWKGENGFVRTFDGTSNLADRIYVLPDFAGTVALIGASSQAGTLYAGTVVASTSVGVGTGTTSPATTLQVVDTGTASPRGITNDQYNTGTNSAQINLRKARGTFATPTTVVTGDLLSRLISWGYDGSNFIESGGLRFTSEGTIASTRMPSKFDIYVGTDAAPSVLTSTATFSGSSGISLTAIGTNQSITLTPSGTGIVYSGDSAYSTNGNQSGTIKAQVIFAGATLDVLDSTALAANNGGGISFSANTRSAGNGYSIVPMAYIRGGKQNAVDNDQGGYLSLASRGTLGSGMQEAIRIVAGFASPGNVYIGNISSGTTSQMVEVNGGVGLRGTNTLKFGATAAATIGVSADTTAGVLTFTAPSSGSFSFTGGVANFSGNVISGGALRGAAASDIQWATRSIMRSPSDGVVTLLNQAETNFSRLQFGGTTASFPAIKRSTTKLQVRLADDSADAAMTLNRLIPGVTSTATAAGTTTLTTSSTMVQIFTGSTTQSVTLPAANLDSAGYSTNFFIKNRSSGTVTINRAGSDTIDGATSYSLTAGNAVHLMSDGVSDWTVQ